VLAAVRACHDDGGSTRPSAVKTMSRQGILRVHVLLPVDGEQGYDVRWMEPSRNWHVSGSRW
jgi:hypothetical protein